MKQLLSVFTLAAIIMMLASGCGEDTPVEGNPNDTCDTCGTDTTDTTDTTDNTVRKDTLPTRDQICGSANASTGPNSFTLIGFLNSADTLDTISATLSAGTARRSTGFEYDPDTGDLIETTYSIIAPVDGSPADSVGLTIRFAGSTTGNYPWDGNQVGTGGNNVTVTLKMAGSIHAIGGTLGETVVSTANNGSDFAGSFCGLMRDDATSRLFAVNGKFSTFQ